MVKQLEGVAAHYGIEVSGTGLEAPGCTEAWDRTVASLSDDLVLDCDPGPTMAVISSHELEQGLLKIGMVLIYR